MTRRMLLTAAELMLAASALSAATYGLVRASYDPYAAVEWVPIAIIGVGTALAFVGFAAVLFTGRAGLMLAADVVTALRRRRAVREARERIAAQAGHGHHRADLPPTVRYSAQDLRAVADRLSAP